MEPLHSCTLHNPPRKQVHFRSLRRHTASYARIDAKQQLNLNRRPSLDRAQRANKKSNNNRPPLHCSLIPKSHLAATFSTPTNAIPSTSCSCSMCVSIAGRRTGGKPCPCPSDYKGRWSRSPKKKQENNQLAASVNRCSCAKAAQTRRCRRLLRRGR